MSYADRIIRFIIAAIIWVLFFTGTITGTTGIVLMVLSFVFLLTGLISFCPLYRIAGISTLEKKEA